MCSYEPKSTDDMSDINYDADSNPGNHLCLIDDVAKKPCGESSRFQDGDTAPDTFPQFMRFPPELRLQIWQLHCPDLSAKARVLPFMKLPISSTVHTQIDCECCLPDYEALAEQTKDLRAVLSTHSESRSIALRKYPDELVMDLAPGAAIFRFRKETDVIFLSDVVIGKDYPISKFASEIENLAVGDVVDCSKRRYFRDGTLLQVVPGIKSLFPNLKRLYSPRQAPTEHNDIEKWWLVEHVHSYMIDSDDQTTMFYWPDLDAHADFARSSVPKLCSLEEMKEAGVELWPMVEFESWKPKEIPDGPELEDDSSSNASSDSDEY
ncbi:hypothetical protein E4U56_003347 [Claviceps arundinis]|uniref:2EXR domain-containing protein n=1 Tax=Claviceps arundinis TaxID=1623583 RepID=A0A9P7MYG9_9HYPO|nr:hypothetical protein E4U56_003347 [Claviceps arundinis]